MKVSLEWISDFVALPVGVDPAELAHQLTLKTVEVEDVSKVDDDVVFEIDNKSLTNRPDLWGHYGLAREFAAIYDLPLAPPVVSARPEAVTGLVGTLDSALCTRFAAVRFTIDQAAPTPETIRRRLARIGENSVNLLVDLSNYVMFTVGQPTAVYDAEAVTLPLSAEPAARDESLELLTGQRAALVAGTPVVRDADDVVSVAGVMGTAASSVTDSSREFVLEAATFRPRPIRHASQRLALRTEASARYEKGLDTQRVDLAVDLFLHLLRETVPGVTISGMQDTVVEPTRPNAITVGREFLDRRIGQHLADAEIVGTLNRLGFGTVVDGATFEIAVPTWRSTGDVSLPHDIVEEVARIHGYDELAVARTTIELEPVRSRHLRPLDRVVREQLAGRGGLREVVTYPWTVDHLLAATGYDKAATVRFEGAPAPDRDSLRPALLPNLLDTIATNLRYRPAFGIFEVGTVFPPGAPAAYKGVYEDLPPQQLRLGIALVGTDGVELFRRAKGLLALAHRHGHLTELTLAGDSAEVWADRSARLAVSADGARIGTVALLTPKLLRQAGIQDVQVAYAEIDLGALAAHTSRENRYRAVPELPEADFDLSVVVADDVRWSDVEAVASAANELIVAVAYVDEFRGSWVPEGSRSLSLRVTLQPTGETLTAEVIAAARTAVLEALAGELGAHLR